MDFTQSLTSALDSAIFKVQSTASSALLSTSGQQTLSGAGSTLQTYYDKLTSGGLTPGELGDLTDSMNTAQQQQLAADAHADMLKISIGLAAAAAITVGIFLFIRYKKKHAKPGQP
jgi:hypothetical protein